MNNKFLNSFRMKHITSQFPRAIVGVIFSKYFSKDAII